MVKKGCRVTVLAPQGPGGLRNEERAGVKIRRFAYFWPTAWQCLCYGSGIPDNLKKSWLAKVQLPCLELAFLCTILQYIKWADVIQAHWELTALPAFLAVRKHKVPVAVMLHHGQAANARNRVNKILVRFADYLIFNSSFTLQPYLPHLPGKGKYSIITLGVDRKRFARKEVSKEQKILSLPSDRKVVVSLGRLIPCKGHEFLLKALAMLDAGLRPYLFIGGTGPLLTPLKAMVKDLGLEGDVFFLGQVPSEEVVALLHLANIYVQPSIIDRDGNTEGLGMAVLEAMACGLPCIASKVGGLVDLVVDGETGFLVCPGDAPNLAHTLHHLLTDDELCQQMGKAALKRVEEHFVWDRVTDKFLDVYRRLL